jgi:membrane protease YdiL (CAAX protease family)
MVSIAGIVVLWIMNVFFIIFYGRNLESSFVQSLASLSSPYFYVGMVMIVVLGPFFEEILMRGFFFEILKIRWNIGISLIITLFFVAITHYSVGGEQLIAIICFNTIFSLLYLEGGLLASILGHMFVNFYIVYVLNG